MKTAMSAVAIGALLLAACAPIPPVVTDITSDKAVIQAAGSTTEASILSEAMRACATHARVPTPISVVCTGNPLADLDTCQVRDHLFACVDTNKP